MHYRYSTIGESPKERWLLYHEMPEVKKESTSPEVKNETNDLKNKNEARKQNLLKRIDAIISSIPQDKTDRVDQWKSIKADFEALTVKSNQNDAEFDALLQSYDKNIAIAEPRKKEKENETVKGMGQEIVSIAKEIDAIKKSLPVHLFKEGAQKQWDNEINLMSTRAINIFNGRDANAEDIQKFLGICRNNLKNIRAFQARQQAKEGQKEDTKIEEDDAKPKDKQRKIPMRESRQDSTPQQQRKPEPEKQNIPEAQEVVDSNDTARKIELRNELSTIATTIQSLLDSLPSGSIKNKKSWQAVVDDIHAHIKDKQDSDSVHDLESYIINPRAYLKQIQDFSKKRAQDSEKKEVDNSHKDESFEVDKKDSNKDTDSSDAVKPNQSDSGETREKEKPKAISSLDKMRVENEVIPALQQAFPSTEWWISPHFDEKGRPYICLKVALRESNRPEKYGPAYNIMTSGLVKPVEVNAEEWQVGGSAEVLIGHVKKHMEREMRHTYFYAGGGERAKGVASQIKKLQPNLVKLMQSELQNRFGDMQCEISEYIGGTRIDATVNGRTVQHYELIQGVDGKYLIIAKKDTSISKVTAEIKANTFQELETKLREHLLSELQKFDVFDTRKDLLAYTHEQWELLKSDERLRSAICEKMGLPKNFPGYLKVEKEGTATVISVHFAFHSPIGHPTPFCLGTLHIDHATKTISDISSEEVKKNREKFSFDFQSREREALMAKYLDTELKNLAAQEYEVDVGVSEFRNSKTPDAKIFASKDRKNRKGSFLSINLTPRKEGDGFSVKIIDVNEYGSLESTKIETAVESPVTAKTLDSEIRKALGVKQAIDARSSEPDQETELNEEGFTEEEQEIILKHNEGGFTQKEQEISSVLRNFH